MKTSHSEILIKMDALPTSRFKRTVVRTTLDLVGKSSELCNYFHKNNFVILPKFLLVVLLVYLLEPHS